MKEITGKEKCSKSTELPKKFQENYPEANSGYEKLVEKVFGSQTIEAKEKNLTKLDKLVLAIERANEDVCALRDFILDDLKSCSKGGENYKLAEHISKKYLAWSAAHIEKIKFPEKMNEIFSQEFGKDMHDAERLGYISIDSSKNVILNINAKALLREYSFDNYIESRTEKLFGSSNSISYYYILTTVIECFVEDLKKRGKTNKKFLEMAICYEESFINNHEVTDRVIQDACIKMGYSASSRNVFYRRKEDAIQRLAETLFGGAIKTFNDPDMGLVKKPRKK